MNPHLLLCESNRSALSELKTYLSSRGFCVDVASNGLDCLRRFRERRPDLVLLDWEMPWGGGDGVLSVMQDEFSTVPVVVSTWNPGTVLRDLCYDGIAEVVCRPLRLKEVYAGILNALRRSESLFASQTSLVAE